jgi:uncharacterized phage protein gp47/JayE
MAFEPKTFAQIFQEMRDRTPATLTDFQEGSVVRTLYESFSWELALLYEQMHRVYLSAYVDTAEEVQLDQVVAVLGIRRGEPDFATGIVSFVRDLGIDEDITIPIGTLVTTEDKPDSPKKAYTTIEDKILANDQTTVQIRVQAVQRGEEQVTDAGTIQVMPQPVPGVKSVTNTAPIQFRGKRRETDEQLRDRAKKALLAASGANTTSIENALLSLPGVKEVKVTENFDEKEKRYGVIEVFVDSIDFEASQEETEAYKNKRQQLLDAIEQVRAAGIYVLLKPAKPIEVDGVFQIALDPKLKLSPEEREKLEKQVQDAIVTHLGEQRMGQPLLVSQLTQNVLAIKGVNDLVDFTLSLPQGKPYRASAPDKTLLETVGVLEKFTPRYIRVASETKPLPVHVHVKAPALTDDNLQTVLDVLKTYFETPKTELKTSEIRGGIVSKIPEIGDRVEVKLIPQFWQPSIPFDGETVNVSFVEQPQLKDVFIYDKFLEINGALTLTFLQTAKSEEKEKLQAHIRKNLETYLEDLQPEADVDLKQFAQVARMVTGVQDVVWKPEDFRTRLPDAIQQQPPSKPKVVENRVSATAIRVEKFEKAQLAAEFLLTSESKTTVAIAITEVALRLDITGILPQNTNRERLTEAIQKTVKTIFSASLLQPKFPPVSVGQTFLIEPFKANFQVLIRDLVSSLSRESIRQSIEKDGLSEEQIQQLADLTKTLLNTANYTLEKLELSTAEWRSLPGGDIAIRSMEQAQIQFSSASQVEVKVELPL